MSLEREPTVAIGHVGLRCVDPDLTARFYEQLGLKRVPHGGALEILELRGGTHLLLFRAKGRPHKGPIKSFDLMVDDLPSSRERFVAAGIPCTEIEKDRWSDHRAFQVTDPDGHVITFVSAHDED